MSAAPSSYLETAVLTAPPQKLQLLLIDACCRFGQRARTSLAEDRLEDAVELLIRCQQIAAQLLAGVSDDHDASLAKRARATYGFLYRTLIETNLSRDLAKLDEALAVLEFERETWRLACEGAAAAKPASIPAPSIAHAPAGFSLNA